MMKDDYDDFNHRSDFTVHMVMMDHSKIIPKYESSSIESENE